MYEHEGVATEAWIKSSKHDVTVVATLGDVGAEAYSRGERFFCKARKVNIVDRTGGGDAWFPGRMARPLRS
jgi:sugar/nucleoside kinase (ribokinase family)